MHESRGLGDVYKRQVEDKLETAMKDIRRENNDTVIAIRSEVSDKEKSIKSILKRDLRIRCQKMESKPNVVTYAANNDPDSLISQLAELQARTVPLIQYKKANAKKRKLSESEESSGLGGATKKRKRVATPAHKVTDDIIIREDTSEFVI